MDILAKIEKMKNDRHWSEYQLAEKSGLTQSTISSWYRKDMTPSIPSLIKICDAFGITISQFFMENSDDSILLTEQQKRLLEYASKLNPAQYNALIELLKNM